MRKLPFLLVGLVVGLGNAPAARAQTTPDPTVLVNGVRVRYDDAGRPENLNGRVMVPMNKTFEALGFTSTWDAQQRKVTAVTEFPSPNPTPGAPLNHKRVTVELWIGNATAKVDGRNVTLPAAPYIQTFTKANGTQAGVTMVPVRFIADATGCLTEFDKETQQVQIYDYNNGPMEYGDWLLYGRHFYFYDSEPGNDGPGDAVGCQKLVTIPRVATGNTAAWYQEVDLRFFDPNKPTIVYVHGIQPGMVDAKQREGFVLSTTAFPDIQAQNEWKARGWNVAIFNWVKYADDGGSWAGVPPAVTESKIYSNTAKEGVSYKNNLGEKITKNLPSPITAWGALNFCWDSPIAVQLYSAYYELRMFSPTQEVRFIGNSLGGNVIMAAMLETHRVNERQKAEGKNLIKMPSRITLIDPYWTPAALDSDLRSLPILGEYGVGSTAELAGVSGEILAEQYGTAIEYYRTSLFGLAGMSERLARVAAFQELTPDYGPRPKSGLEGTMLGLANAYLFGLPDVAFQHVYKHTAPVRQYLATVGQTPPAEVVNSANGQQFPATGKAALSSATPTARVREMMAWANGVPAHWKQVAGGNTHGLADDQFLRVDGKAYPEDNNCYTSKPQIQDEDAKVSAELAGKSPQPNGTDAGAAKPARSSQPENHPLYFGLPNPAANNSRTNRTAFLRTFTGGADAALLRKVNFVSCWNDSKGAPDWAAWHTDARDISPNPNSQATGRSKTIDFFLPDNEAILNRELTDVRAYGYQPGPLPGSFDADGKWIQGTSFRYVFSATYACGFTRGHLCPAGDRAFWRQPTATANDQPNPTAANNAYAETFRTSNIVPQNYRHNDKIWQRLETYAHALINNGNYELYTYAGTSGVGGIDKSGSTQTQIGNLAENKRDNLVVRDNRVTVPKYLWKVIIAVPAGTATPDLDKVQVDANGNLKNGVRIIAVWLENKDYGDDPWYDYRISLAQLQTNTGLQFLTEIKDAALRTKLLNLVDAVPVAGDGASMRGMAPSSSLAAGTSAEAAGLNVYPNTVQHELNVTFSQPLPGSAHLSLYNAVGDRVAEVPVPATSPAGEHTVRYDASRLAPGVYFLRSAVPGQPAGVVRVVKGN